jgi:hypothetical protein
VTDAAALDASPKGLWWKSLVLAWLLSRLIGVAVLAADVELSDAVGIAIFAAVWAATWLAWRRWSRSSAPTSLFAPRSSVLGMFQRTTAAFAATTVGCVPLVAAIEAGAIERTDVKAAPVAAAVTAVAVLSLLGGRAWVPRLHPAAEELTARVGRYRSRHFAQLAWSMLPTVAGLGAVALLGGEAWVYAIGATASLVEFWLAFPTESRARRDGLDDVLVD